MDRQRNHSQWEKTKSNPARANPAADEAKAAPLDPSGSNPGAAHRLVAQPLALAERGVLTENAFRRMLGRERKRAVRSQTPFLLALLEIENAAPAERNGKTLGAVLEALAAVTRETDLAGWFEQDSVAGMLFTEIALGDPNASLAAITARISATLRRQVSARQLSRVSISFHVFPEERPESAVRPGEGVPAVYAGISAGEAVRRMG